MWKEGEKKGKKGSFFFFCLKLLLLLFGFESYYLTRVFVNKYAEVVLYS